VTLDPDAATVVQAIYAAGFHRPFRDLGVQASRRLIKARPVPPAPSVRATRDVEVPRGHASVSVRIYGASATSVRPVVVWVHGGGFILGDLSSGDATCRSLAAKADCAVVNVDYRLAPEHPYPAAFEDVLAVVRWIGTDGERYGLDKRRIILAGESAGAHLSAATSVVLRDEAVAPVLQVLICPSTQFSTDWPSMAAHADGPLARRDDVEWFWSQYIADEQARTDPLAAPALAPLDHYTVPALIITADHDPLVDDGRAYAQRLKEAGVEVDYREYSGVMHGFFRFVGQIGKADAAESLVVQAIRSRAK
jgi:acetyl esterase/lipase